MVFYAAFNIISVISRRQPTLFMSFLGFTSAMLGLWSDLAKGHSREKKDRIQCGSNPGPRDNVSNTFHWAMQDPDRVNPLPDTPISGFSKSEANKDMMSKIWTNGDTIIWSSRKHCGKRRNCSLRAISPFHTMFSKTVCSWCVKMSIYGVKS